MRTTVVISGPRLPEKPIILDHLRRYESFRLQLPITVRMLLEANKDEGTHGHVLIKAGNWDLFDDTALDMDCGTLGSSTFVDGDVRSPTVLELYCVPVTATASSSTGKMGRRAQQQVFLSPSASPHHILGGRRHVASASASVARDEDDAGIELVDDANHFPRPRDYEPIRCIANVRDMATMLFKENHTCVRYDSDHWRTLPESWHWLPGWDHAANPGMLSGTGQQIWIADVLQHILLYCCDPMTLRAVSRVSRAWRYYSNFHPLWRTFPVTRDVIPRPVPVGWARKTREAWVRERRNVMLYKRRHGTEFNTGLLDCHKYPLSSCEVCALFYCYLGKCKDRWTDPGYFVVLGVGAFIADLATLGLFKFCMETDVAAGYTEHVKGHYSGKGENRHYVEAHNVWVPATAAYQLGIRRGMHNTFVNKLCLPCYLCQLQREVMLRMPDKSSSCCEPPEEFLME